MKKILGGILLFSLLSPISLQAAPDDDAYSPMESGFSWVYDTVHKTKKERFEMKVVIEDEWEEKGLSGVIMTQKDKRGTMREFLMTTDKGILIHKLGLSKGYTPEVFSRFTPAVPKVIYPLTPGTKVHWQGRLKVKAAFIDKPITFDGEVVGFEEIEVPAGKFKCVKLFYDQKRGEERVQETAWYAEGVGQVKYDGGEYVKELKSFKKP